jgi:PQQ-like domain
MAPPDSSFRPVPRGRHLAARRASRRTIRRRRIGVAVVALLVVALIAGLAIWATSGSTGEAPPTTLAQAAGTARHQATTTTVPAQSTTSVPSATPTKKKTEAQIIAETGKLPAGDIPAIEAGLLPWTLSAPLSREVAITGTGGQVTLLGGLLASQATTPNIVSINTVNGQASTVGTLAAGVHDASGAQVGSTITLYGGGSPNTVATVQSLPAPTTIPVPAKVTSTVGAPLPQPRSDSEAVTIGTTTYVVGGYTGSGPITDVLATTDGQHFTTVAALPDPVRYPAVATLDGMIYLFGGEIVGGTQDGWATDAIQVVDPTTKSARVIGHLPEPLAGAVAIVLDKHLYIAGGTTSTSAAQTTAQAHPPTTTTTAKHGTTTTTNPPVVSVPPYTATTAVWAYDTATNKVLNAGHLYAPTSFTAAAVVGDRAWLFGGENNQQPMSSVEMMVPNARFGAAGMDGAGSPYFAAKLLIADRGNNRLLVIDNNNQILWNYPSIYAPAPPGGFYFPDDAFFAKQGTEIISNQEQNETIVILGFPSGSVLWQYGHPLQTGTAAGYLNEPDDAYLLKNGEVTVADADNCRILFINQADKTVTQQIGNTLCTHNPPVSLGSPNGDTPLSDGNVLASEINGSWISEYTPTGTLVWTVKLPSIGYVSDPQQLGPDLYLVSDYSHPGAIVEFNREGQILFTYKPTSGPGELNQPSLTELLPSGVLMSNDDYRDRMVAIDPATQALVWQYGVTDTQGTAPGMLNTPDGFDLLMPDGSTPTHPFTS